MLFDVQTITKGDRLMMVIGTLKRNSWTITAVCQSGRRRREKYELLITELVNQSVLNIAIAVFGCVGYNIYFYFRTVFAFI